MKEQRGTKAFISLSQFIMLLVVSRVFNNLTYVPFFTTPVEGTAMLYGAILATLFLAVALLPVIILYVKYPGESVLTIAWKKHKLWGYTCTAIYLIFTVLYLIGGIAGFNYFVMNAVYPQASIWVVAITMCSVCFFATKSGLQGLARLSGIVFILFTAGLIFITIVSTPSIKLLNIKPLIDNPMQSIISYAISTATKNSEIAFLILLMPHVRIREKAKRKTAPVKAVLGLLGISLAFTLVIDFLVSAVLGNLSLTQAFPYFSLTAIIEMNLFQRLDAVHMVTWVCVSFVHVTLHAMIAAMLLRDLLPQKARTLSTLALYLLSTVAAVALGQQIELLNSTNEPTYIVTATSIILIPLIAFFLARSKDNKNKGGQQDGKNKTEYEEIFSNSTSAAPPM